jgi:hypothetical protein
MATLKNVIENINLITKAIKTFGFNSAILFKGFCEEEHNFNLVVTDQDSQEVPSEIRSLKLEDNLTKLLKCKVIVTTKNQMDDFYFK